MLWQSLHLNLWATARSRRRWRQLDIAIAIAHCLAWTRGVRAVHVSALSMLSVTTLSPQSSLAASRPSERTHTVHNAPSDTAISVAACQQDDPARGASDGVPPPEVGALLVALSAFDLPATFQLRIREMHPRLDRHKYIEPFDKVIRGSESLLRRAVEGEPLTGLIEWTSIARDFVELWASIDSLDETGAGLFDRQLRIVNAPDLRIQELIPRGKQIRFVLARTPKFSLRFVEPNRQIVLDPPDTGTLIFDLPMLVQPIPASKADVAALGRWKWEMSKWPSSPAMAGGVEFLARPPDPNSVVTLQISVDTSTYLPTAALHRERNNSGSTLGFFTYAVPDGEKHATQLESVFAASFEAGAVRNLTLATISEYHPFVRSDDVRFRVRAPLTLIDARRADHKKSYDLSDIELWPDGVREVVEISRE